MLSPELFKRVRRIQVRTSHAVDAVLAGQYHSAFKGRGVEFEEVRPYQFGDDVRAIDWNVTARSDQPYVKLFREERDLTIRLLIDVSASQSFGTREQLKRELAAELGALLAFAAIRNNDSVGLLLFTDEVERVVPPRKGMRHVLRLVRELLLRQPDGRGTSIRKVLEHLNRTARRRSVVFLVSDFLDEGYAGALRIAARRHDLIPVVLSDPAESGLPPIGLAALRDAESGRTVTLDTSSRRQRDHYRRVWQDRTERRERLFRALRLDWIDLQTGDDPVQPIRRLFLARGGRR